MIRISKKYSFDSAHQLHRADWTPEKNKQVFGKCNRLHGHTYTLEVEVEGPTDLLTGMVLNYFELDGIMKPLVEHFDHKMLNEIFPSFLTTSENMVMAIATEIQSNFVSVPYYLHRVTLSETPKTTATGIADTAENREF